MVLSGEANYGGFVAPETLLCYQMLRPRDYIGVRGHGEEGSEFVIEIFGIAGQGLKDLDLRPFGAADADHAYTVMELAAELDTGNVNGFGPSRFRQAPLVL